MSVQKRLFRHSLARRRFAKADVRKGNGADGKRKSTRKSPAASQTAPEADHNRGEMIEKLSDGPVEETNLSLEDVQNRCTALVEYCLANCSRGAVWLMEGDLGAGKTTFVAAAAHALGIEDVVNSPTFNLHNHYTGLRGELNHFDLYRLGSSAMMELEFSEIWESPGEHFALHAIEWWTNLGTIHSALPFFRITLEIVDERRRNLRVQEIRQFEVHA
tara:strand:+ start:66627 stop:67277 length:651 start_codon:yes stop_codon:yes gene_type:complete